VPLTLDIAVYAADRPDDELFSGFVEAALALGATWQGRGVVCRRTAQFIGPFDADCEQREIEPFDLRAQPPGRRITQIHLGSPFRDIGGSPDATVTYLSVSASAARADRHPLALRLDAELLDDVSSESEARQAARFSEAVYEFFLALVGRLRPSYGAIAVEYGLETPTDLGRDARSLAFLDFYVSASFLGAASLRKVKDIFAEAHIEETADGIYVSASGFNPDGTQLDRVAATWNSASVGEVIGKSGAGSRGAR
jgi:hypothetical protein